MEVDTNLISARINQRNIKTALLLPAYLNYRLDKKRLDWFRESMSDATTKVNRDSAPFAVFETLVIWNKQFSTAIAHFFEFFQNSDLGCAAIFVFIVTFILVLLSYRKPFFSKMSLAYSIGTTGFFGMLMSLVLVFSFQAYYGYLYYQIGMLISIFMAGAAWASILITRYLPRIKRALSLFFGIEMLIILFSGILAFILSRILGHIYSLALIFAVLFFISGFLVGLEFPLACRIYSDKESQIGRTSGLLYFSDLAGGWIAGILGGIVFLPILGLFNTCMLAILFKLSSLALFMSANK
jgi:spermidine synthase